MWYIPILVVAWLILQIYIRYDTIIEDDLKKEENWQGLALQYILPKISWTILTIVIEWWYRKTSYRRCPGQSRSGRLRYTNTNIRDITNIITYHCTVQSVNNQWGQSRVEQEYWHKHRHCSQLLSGEDWQWNITNSICIHHGHYWQAWLSRITLRFYSAMLQIQ